MAKIVASASGIHKTKLIKRGKNKNNNGVLKKVIDYLKSDGYMFAPLFSFQFSDFSPPNSVSITSTGVDGEGPFEENNKKLLVKVGEYLKSDCHMYAPLVLHQPSLSSNDNEASPQTGLKEAAEAATPAEKTTEERKQPAKQTTNTLGDHQESDSHPLDRTVVRQTVSFRKEAVKHIVHQHCRSSSVTGSVLETGARNVVVE